MNQILHNPLTDLPLPYFLGLYAAGALIGLVAGSLWIWLCDGTRDEDLPEDSELPDPYETAFLCGNAERVTQLVVFDLLERGYVELRDMKSWFPLFAPRRQLRRRAETPPVADLTPVQRAAWNWLAHPRSPGDLNHRHIGLLKAIRSQCQTYVQPLELRRLLETSGRRTACQAVGWTLATGIVSLGCYKLVTAIISGRHESLCLILMMVVGLLFTAIICRQQRLSDLGHRTLEGLRTTYGDDASIMAEPRSSRFAEAPGGEASADRLLAMALFGTVGSRHADDHLSEPSPAGQYREQSCTADK